MIPDKIQSRCLQTWFDDSVSIKDQYLHAALGLNAEAGELASLIDKAIYKPGSNISSGQVLDELGDVYYYVVILAYLNGVTLEGLEAANAAKLKSGHGWSKKL